MVLWLRRPLLEPVFTQNVSISLQTAATTDNSCCKEQHAHLCASLPRVIVFTCLFLDHVTMCAS